MAPMSLVLSPALVSTLCEVSAIALVRVVTISTVRANIDPMIVGTMPDQSPSGAEKLPMLAYAIPSGMEKSPLMNPETTSLPVGRPNFVLRLIARSPPRARESLPRRNDASPSMSDRRHSIRVTDEHSFRFTQMG